MSALERLDPPQPHLLTVTIPEDGPAKLYIDGEYARDLIAPCTLEAWTYLAKEDVLGRAPEEWTYTKEDALR